MKMLVALVIVFAIDAYCAGITQDLMTDIVDTHNKLRALYSINTPLAYDATLQSVADQRVQYQVDICDLSHTGHGIYGENLAMGTGNTIDMDTQRRLVQLWVNEAAPFTDGVYNHFTQMIWANTSSMACSMASGCGNVFVACNYYPAGNVISLSPYAYNPQSPSGGMVQVAQAASTYLRPYVSTVTYTNTFTTTTNVSVNTQTVITVTSTYVATMIENNGASNATTMISYPVTPSSPSTNSVNSSVITMTSGTVASVTSGLTTVSVITVYYPTTVTTTVGASITTYTTNVTTTVPTTVYTTITPPTQSAVTSYVTQTVVVPTNSFNFNGYNKGWCPDTQMLPPKHSHKIHKFLGFHIPHGMKDRSGPILAVLVNALTKILNSIANMASVQMNAALNIAPSDGALFGVFVAIIGVLSWT